MARGVRARLITAESRERAEQLLKMAAANPASFGDIAKEHSAGHQQPAPSARGLIPPIRRHVGDPTVEAAAFRLKEGQISQVIEAGGQFLILKCERILPETYIPSEEIARVKGQLAEKIRDEKLRGAASNLFKQLRQTAQIVEVYSDPQKRKQYPNVAALINGRSLSLEQLSNECLERHAGRRAGRRDQPQGHYAGIAATATDGHPARGGRRDPPSCGRLRLHREWPGQCAEMAERGHRGGWDNGRAVHPRRGLAIRGSQSAREVASASDRRRSSQGFESNYGERVRVLAAVLASHRQAQEVWEMAKKQNSDRAFGELAYKYSIEPVSRSNYGQVPPIRKHSGHDELEKGGLSAETGRAFSIVATGDKYVILWCLGRTTPKVTEFAAVRDELYADLLETKLRVKMQEEFDRLRRSSRIQNLVTQTPAMAPVRPAAATTPTARRSPQPIRR